jgi:hypothetical protein
MRAGISLGKPVELDWLCPPDVWTPISPEIMTAAKTATRPP